MNRRDVREAIAKNMKHELTDEMFETAQRAGILAGIIDDEASAEAVAADLDMKIDLIIGQGGQQALDIAFRLKKVEGRSTGDRSALWDELVTEIQSTLARYEQAMSVLLADEANRIEGWLHEFRMQHLNSRLLDVYEIGDWIEDRLTEGEHPVDEEEAQVREGIAGLLQYPAQTLKVDDNEVLVPGLIQTIEGSMLDKLHRLNIHLCNRYGWQEVDTTAFILADRPPDYEEFRASVDTRSPVPAAWKIRLEVSPILSPDEVAKRYQDVRNREFGAEGRRAKRPGKKRTALALFDAMHWRDHGGTWKEKLTDWNFFCTYLGLHGFDEDWRYRWESNLRRDLPKARQDLLYPVYLRERNAQDQQGELEHSSNEGKLDHGKAPRSR